MIESINQYLLNKGVSEVFSSILARSSLFIIVLLFAGFVKILTDKVILKMLSNFIRHNKVKWDVYFLDRGVFTKLSHLVPAIIIFFFTDLFPLYSNIMRRMIYVYMVVVVLSAVNSSLDALNDIYNKTKYSKDKPIKGFIQVAKLVAAIMGGVTIISSLIGQNPLVILSGLGALTAVLLIVFKDSLLGLVAGIQISANDMVRIGDWIEMPKYNADGDVIDISLNTIKVQNFDRTITTIPSYAVISDSFKNWRGMQESGGRRIMRSINIDVNSIKFLEPKMINKLKKINCLKDYIAKKEKEISKYNISRGLKDSPANQRKLTNIGTFRAYIDNYLKKNNNTHKEMLSMVRQLAPTQYGLPLQIYTFTNTTDWVKYENIQSDIFDHILAIAKEFDLRIFQEPSGIDMKEGLSKR